MTITAVALPSPRLLDPQSACLHVERMYRALRMTRSPHDAEDLTQEALAKVLARPRLIQNGDDLGYLLRALKNIHLSARRSAGRHPCVAVAPETLEFLPRRGSDPQAAAEAREILVGIARLPEGQRDVIVAVDLRGLSYAEAAATLCVPEGTIMSRLHRARAALAS